MNTPTNHIFVYGSLRSGFQSNAYHYISQYFTLLGVALTKGILYDKGDYPVAVPTTEEKYLVGELYVINSPTEFGYAIGQLDDYEGIYTEEGETPLYKKELTTVILNKETYTAWVYWYNGDTLGLPQLTSGDVMQYLNEKNK